MTTGTMCVAFGFLNRIKYANTFINLSFVVRIVEAFGNSAFLAASFTMVAKMFPETVATMFGMVEMAFGVGMIIGRGFRQLLEFSERSKQTLKY